MNYRLSCTDFNDAHVKFALFDRTGANCGHVTVLRADVYRFLGEAWLGNVDWNSKNLDINAGVAARFHARQRRYSSLTYRL